MIVSMVHPVTSMARAAVAPAVGFVSANAAQFVDVSTSAVVAPLLLLRGGAESTALDIARVRLRLDGLHSYAVMTTLLMNASLRLFSSTPKKLVDNEKRQDRIAKILFAITIGTSIVAGAYTTVVFSLCGLYSKSALGLEKDIEYIKFFDATQSYRNSAFECFVLSLLFFKASFVLSLFLSYEGKMRWWTAGIVLALAICSVKSWSSIMIIAGKLLYSK